MMKRTDELLRTLLIIFLFFSVMIWPGSLLAQENQISSVEGDTLIAIARELIAEARYCALITLDSSGHPHARAMEPFPPEDDMTVWFGTTRNSRKVQEIRHDSRVILYCADCLGNGYLTLAGTAQMVDDAEEKTRRWNQNWETFYPDREKDYILIKVTPKQLDLLSMKHGITGDDKTWRVPSVDF
jgi:general stress protein 26